MDTNVGNKDRDRITFYWSTEYVLDIFNLTCDELRYLMEHGYVLPEIFENEDCTLTLEWNSKTFHAGYVDWVKSEAIQSITEQSE